MDLQKLCIIFLVIIWFEYISATRGSPILIVALEIEIFWKMISPNIFEKISTMDWEMLILKC